MAKRHRIEFRDRIIELAKQGMNLSNIANELCINRLDVKIVLQENHLYHPRKKMNSLKTDLQQKAIKLYLDGNSLAEIERKLDFPRKAVSKLLKERNIPLRVAGDYNKKYSVDDNVFSSYTPESAYWAGFIAGDGCIYSHGLANKNNNYLNVTLQITDEQHLHRLKTFLKYDGVLYYKNTGTAVSLTVNSLQICKDLNEKYNISNNKTYDYIPSKNIPEEFMKYFILGLIDADGSILKHKRTHQTNNRLRGEYVYQIGFTGTYETCVMVRDFFGSTVQIHTRHKNRENNNYTVLFQGNEQVLKLCSMIYDKQTNLFCLKRKYKNYLSLKEEYSRIV